jgi:hypothetical protein
MAEWRILRPLDIGELHRHGASIRPLRDDLCIALLVAAGEQEDLLPNLRKI